jgi:hypothetical protein
MRIIGIIILIAVAFTSAQTRIMHIHLKDGTTDSIYCSRLDADIGVIFSKTKMRVAVIDTMDNGSLNRSVLWFCTGQIDSITFDSIGGPSPAGLAKFPAPNQQVSNTMPRPVNQRVTTHDATPTIERKRTVPEFLRLNYRTIKNAAKIFF